MTQRQLMRHLLFIFLMTILGTLVETEANMETMRFVLISNFSQLLLLFCKSR